MKARILSGILMGGVLVFGAGAAAACEVAGPNKHVGPVTAVDRDAATFTILDAETQAPITFAANRSILKDASRAQGQVMVSYEDNDGKLRAVDIHF